MLTYAARAVPWGRIFLAAGLVAVCMELVRWDRWVLWPLEGTAVGLLVAAAAWCFDETAAVVVDVAPRGLAWRSAARSPGILVLVVVWTGVVLHAGSVGTFDHRAGVLGQGLVALVVGASIGCWRRAVGEPTPGLWLATAVVPLMTAWALVRPAARLLAVFPYATTTPRGWQVSAAAWAVTGLLAVCVLAAALADAPWWRRRRLHWLSPAGQSPSR
jgi:hypothetical protein